MHKGPVLLLSVILAAVSGFAGALDPQTGPAPAAAPGAPAATGAPPEGPAGPPAPAADLLIGKWNYVQTINEMDGMQVWERVK